MFDNFQLTLTFDDVLLVPRVSSIASRAEVSLQTRFSRRIKLNIPIVSSPMDTVTEDAMAISLARLGGLGIIHRFTTIREQAQMVERVKRAENIVIENPYQISPDATLAEARRLSEEYNVTGFMVVKDGKLVGVLSRRDMLFQPDSRLVREVMTPRERLIVAKEGITLEEAKEVLWKYRIEKLPIVDDEWRLKGLITAADIVKKMKYPNAARDPKGRLLVGASVGVKGDYLKRAQALVESGADVLVIDVANGYLELVAERIKELKREFPDVDVVGGNVASEEGAEMLAKAGADAIRVGIGAGSVCITRVVAGVGVPQLSAILDCRKVSLEYGVPIIADGGIRNSGDIVKALAAGASTVMIGRLFAGTDESPGKIVMRGGRRYKIYRGMASFYAKLGKEIKEGWVPEDLDLHYLSVEGVEAYVEYRGSVEDIVRRLAAGVRAGMAYLGARTVEELPQKAIFVRITGEGLKESYPHDVEII